MDTYGEDQRGYEGKLLLHDTLLLSDGWPFVKRTMTPTSEEILINGCVR